MGIYEDIEEETKKLAEESENEGTAEASEAEDKGEEKEDSSNGEGSEAGGAEGEPEEGGAGSGDDEGEEKEASGTGSDKAEEPADDTEDKKLAEEPVTNSDFARMRREKKALEDKVKALQEAPVQQPVQTQPETPVSDEPDRTEDPAAWLEWNDKRIEADLQEMKAWKAEQQETTDHNNLYKEATNEFQNIEKEFKATTPDYDKAATHYVKQLANGVKMLNPGMSNEQLGKAVQSHILQQAGKFVSKGLNPAEELYHLAKDNGYTAEEPKQEDPKPKGKAVDLKKVDANRRRSATGLSGGGGDSNASYTLEDVANMTNGQLAKLDPNIIRELEANGE